MYRSPWNTAKMIYRGVVLAVALTLTVLTGGAQATHKGEGARADGGPRFYVHAGPEFNSNGGIGAYAVWEADVPTIAAEAPSRAARVLTSLSVADPVMPYGYLGGRFHVREICEGACERYWAPLVAIVTRRDGSTLTLMLWP